MRFQYLIPSPQTGASDDAIADLANWMGRGIPVAFADLLRFSNGFENWSLSVKLWSAESIPTMNAFYGIAEFVPGLILIGSNGEDQIGFDTKSESDPDRWPVVLVMVISAGRVECIEQAPSFHAWIEAGFPLPFPGTGAE